MRQGNLSRLTKNASTLDRKIAQSWSLIPLVLIVSELSLKIANSE